MTYILFFLVVGFVNNVFSNPFDVDFKKFDKPVYAEKIILIVSLAIIVCSFSYQVNIKPTLAAMNFNNNFNIFQ